MMNTTIDELLPLTQAELEETQGGLGPVGLLVVGAIAAGVISDWSGFKKGFMEAF